jgi:hypothetical protein
MMSLPGSHLSSPIANKKSTRKGCLFYWQGQKDWLDFLCKKSAPLLVVFLFKFTFFIFEFENLNFGHSFSIGLLRGAYATLRAGKLRRLR